MNTNVLIIIVVSFIAIIAVIVYIISRKTTSSLPTNATVSEPTTSITNGVVANLINGNTYLIQNVSSTQYITLKSSQYKKPAYIALTNVDKSVATPFKYYNLSFNPSFGTNDQIGYPDMPANLFKSSTGKYLLFNITQRPDMTYYYSALNTLNSNNQVIVGHGNSESYKDFFENLLKTETSKYEVQFIADN
jgi:cell shape-determining protein MreC